MNNYQPPLSLLLFLPIYMPLTLYILNNCLLVEKDNPQLSPKIPCF